MYCCLLIPSGTFCGKLVGLLEVTIRGVCRGGRLLDLFRFCSGSRGGAGGEPSRSGLGRSGYDEERRGVGEDPLCDGDDFSGVLLSLTGWVMDC